MNKINLLISATLLLSAPSFASKPTKITECWNKTKANGITSEMRDCTALETEYHDKRLNQVYQKLLSKLSPEKQKALRHEQRAWLKNIHQQADAAYTETGGTMDLLNGDGVIPTETEKRANELERRLNQ
ncbi:lysozyme inhibitor LprI family protein [Kingella negevensis]|uniref:lysozyme inhibitor LprI family protein n=1 Tax=Kingella negevensis TaxID=1522312 RepID=UPI00254B8658|nr:lysozyme inhibitor LprI family protein [Kingella negevensis]MDK4689654.1 lysozyme inhibitor LprI family protein [Kingella negevensis]